MARSSLSATSVISHRCIRPDDINALHAALIAVHASKCNLVVSELAGNQLLCAHTRTRWTPPDWAMTQARAQSATILRRLRNLLQGDCGR